MFHGGEEEKSSSVALVGGNTLNWWSSRCERICRACLLLGGLGECQRSDKNMSGENGAVKRGIQGAQRADFKCLICIWEDDMQWWPEEKLSGDSTISTCRSEAQRCMCQWSSIWFLGDVLTKMMNYLLIYRGTQTSKHCKWSHSNSFQPWWNDQTWFREDHTCVYKLP